MLLTRNGPRHSKMAANLFDAGPSRGVRRAAGRARIKGVDLSDAARNAELGRQIVAFRAAFTVEAIKTLRAAAAR